MCALIPEIRADVVTAQKQTFGKLGYLVKMVAIAIFRIAKYRVPMARHAFLLLLVCALFVPRVAWGAHEAGHDQLVGPKVEHVHHGDHSHEVSVDLQGDHKPHDESNNGLVHDHLPADVLSAMADIDADEHAESVAAFTERHLIDRRRFGDPSVSPDSLLRPPREA